MHTSPKFLLCAYLHLRTHEGGYLLPPAKHTIKMRSLHVNVHIYVS